VLIAQLMLEPADILLLDEPTNDLDIPTMDILEESLMEFSGSLVLVTHDRYMLDRVANIVLGLNGQGGAEPFADYAQWEGWQREAGGSSSGTLGGTSSAGTRAGATSARESGKASASRKKLSYLEAREYATIEQRIAEAEELVQAQRAELEDPANATDAGHLVSAQAALDEVQRKLDELYERWAELEAKQN
jgi:ATP-binding cassette subfamily F protein uup